MFQTSSLSGDSLDACFKQAWYVNGYCLFGCIQPTHGALFPSFYLDFDSQVEFAWKVIESGNFVLHDQGDLIRENDIEYRMNVYHRRNAQEVNYLSLCKEIVEKGEYRPDRTGVGTHAVFGKTLRFDLQRGFPLLTSKRVFFRGVILELLWMISGNTSSKRLSQQGVRVR
jgi:hypothetical protein